MTSAPYLDLVFTYVGTPSLDAQKQRPNRELWFSLEGEEGATPFWKPFPWFSLRRL
jgi:hypothetical protein